ncbi:MAG TPA: hypothetical protein VGR55_09960 [Candidatus Acidoferrum sp.]|nr:hypothetical protein [Candidatus Acidoferrum sp.]
MSHTITVVDESAPGKPTATFILELDSHRLTARELIRHRLRQEVAKFNAARPAAFQGLIQPTDTESELNGYRLKKFRMLDWEKQFEVALRSFEANGFFLLVDGKQVGSLDEELELNPTTKVQFIKLVPLVGG